MLKKLSDYEDDLLKMVEAGKPLTAEQLLSVRTHIGFFQHERLVHELVMILFALLTVGGILFLVVVPEISVLENITTGLKTECRGCMTFMKSLRSCR